MSEHIEFDGRIVEGSKSIFKVELLTKNKYGEYEPTNSIVQCTIGGKLRKNKINLTSGDLVRIKVSPYDLSRGFIVYRM